MNCPLCERVEATKNQNYPFLVHEFKHSFLYLGEHQYYRGYCVLVTKNHYREMTSIPENIRSEFFQELMKTHELLEKVFTPKKMNLESLGNVVDHMHWHFFPRYEDDVDFKKPPFLQMDRFNERLVGAEERSELIEILKAGLKTL